MCDKPKEHLILHGKLVSTFSRLNLEMKMLEGFISPGTKQTVKNNEVTVVGVCKARFDHNYFVCFQYMFKVAY